MEASGWSYSVGINGSVDFYRNWTDLCFGMDWEHTPPNHTRVLELRIELLYPLSGTYHQKVGGADNYRLT